MHFPDTGFTIGNCQIQFHTSGESAEEKDPIIINPKDIRDMAGWVLDKCVLEEELGGFVTKNLANAVDWLLDPKSDFAEPMRQFPRLPPVFQILSIHASKTFARS